jgi:PAS domain S-box-containing protein
MTKKPVSRKNGGGEDRSGAADSGQDAVSRILDVLKKNPRGVNISEIAEATGINRMSVARYLEVLTALETTEVRTSGNAKLFYLSRRVPVTTFMKFTTKPFIVVDRDGIIVQVNDAIYSRYIDHPRNEILGAPIIGHVRKRALDAGSWERAFEKAMKGEEVMVESGDRCDGSVIWYSLTMMPIAFPDGSPGVIIIGDDITEKKRIADALAEKEDTCRRSLEVLADTFPGLVRIDPATHRIEYMSRRFIQERGRDSTGDFCHKAFFDLDAPCPGCVADRVAAGETLREILESRRNGVSRRITRMPVAHGDGSVSVMVVIEDTDRPEQESGARPEQE